jgi:uncharacterized delta-60 repeat protein
MGKPTRVRERTFWTGLALGALLLALLTAAPAAAMAAGRPAGFDPSFGTRGVATPALPDGVAPSAFELIAPAAGGKLLVTYATSPVGRLHYFTVIERREADGAPDPSFGVEGAVTVEGPVGALAEDPSGGVVYGGDGGPRRLLPSGAPDKAFDANANDGPYGATSILFDSQGAILVGGTNPLGPRYHPHAGEAEVVRYQADGRPDRAYGTNGVAYLGPGGEGTTQLAWLPDGSLLVGPSGRQLSADGIVTQEELEAPPGEGSEKLAVFPDGSFAIARSPGDRPGCKVTRYTAGRAVDRGFGQNGSFTAPELAGCVPTTTSEGGLIVSGQIPTGDREGTPRLDLLTSSGAPATGFGDGGSLTVPGPAGAAVTVEGLAVTPAGRIVVAAGGAEAVLVGLGPNGTLDPGFGAAGMVVKPALLPALTLPRGIAAEPDGELIVTGTTDSGAAAPRPFWMRLGADGSVLPTASGAPFALVPEVRTQLRPAGARFVYAFVEREVGDKSKRYLAKFTRDGAPVESFGDDDAVPTPKGFVASSYVVDPDGGVTVVGSIGSPSRMAAYRLTAAGGADLSFGHGGLASVGPGGSRGSGVAPAPGGGLVISGASGTRLAVAELSPDGHLRRGFGRRGIFTCDCVRGRPARTNVLARDGSIYVLDRWGGSFGDSGGEGTTLVKVTGGGRLGRSFAGRGYRQVSIGSPTALFARGDRLIVAGQKALSSGPVELREFRLDGGPAGSWRGGGRLVAGERFGKASLPVTEQGNGRIVAAGAAPPELEADGGVLKLIGLR